MEDNEKKLIKIFGFSSIGCLPLVFVLFISVLFVLGLLGGDGSGDGEVCVNVKSADEICSSITVGGVTMSVDEYVAGVVYHEFSGASGYENTLKAQAIAARSYGLHGAQKDSSGSCIIGDTSEAFQTFSSTYPDEFKKIAEETSGMIMVDENGDVAQTFYSSNSLPNAYNTYGDTIIMAERGLEIPRTWWQSHKTCSDSQLNTYRSDYKVYGCGHGLGMGQIAAWYLDMEKGYDYTEILEYFYGSDSGYNYSLASTKGATTKCTSTNNGNFQSLSSYNLSHDGLKKLNRTLTASEIDKLNSYINLAVDKAGYGTGEAVAAAGQSLTHGLEQIGYYLGYYWGGDRTSLGVGTRWGANVGYAYTSNQNATGPEFGMDCSGFVSWAIRNACDSNYSSITAVQFLDLTRDRVSLKDAKPGDVLANSGHVILIVKNNGDGTVVAVEESFGAGGLVFKKYDSSTASNYTLVDMSNWYSNHCKSSR